MELNIWEDPKRENIPSSLEDFLKQLNGPTAIHLTGKQKDRTRILVTLSHGNEPSGLQALYEWLLEGKIPEVNIVAILGGVEAALTSPMFYYRHLPHKRDLNRCFSPPYDCSQGKLALAILDHIKKSKAEAVVDMHNTSGSGHPFAVSFHHNEKKQKLASLFVDGLIISKHNLGSLMEQDLGIPLVTVEVGGAKDALTATVAKKGLERYFLTDDLFKGSSPITVMQDPFRMELRPNYKISYADYPTQDSDVTIRKDIERFNFTLIGKEDILGWAKGADLFQIYKDKHSHNDVDEFFLVKEGKLYPKCQMRLFMATTRSDIAISDCLFYFMAESP